MALVVRPKLAKLDLLPAIKDNKTNAYCKFTYEKNHLTSKVHHNCGRSPDWNDELTFNVYNPQGTIWVEVFHQQPPHDILLGVGYIALKSLELDPYERKPCELVLMSGGVQQVKTGVATISFQYIPSDIQAAVPHFQESKSEQRLESPPTSDIPQISSQTSSGDNAYKPGGNGILLSAVGTGIQITESRVIYERKQESRRQKSKPKEKQPPITKLPQLQAQIKPQPPLSPVTPPLNNLKQPNIPPSNPNANLNPNYPPPNQLQNNLNPNHLSPQQNMGANLNKFNQPLMGQVNAPAQQKQLPMNQMYQQVPPQPQIPIAPQQIPNVPAKVPQQAAYQAANLQYGYQPQYLAPQPVVQPALQQIIPGQQLVQMPEVYMQYVPAPQVAYDLMVPVIQQDYIEVIPTQPVPVQVPVHQSLYASSMAPAYSPDMYKQQLQVGMQAVLKQKEQADLQTKMARELANYYAKNRK